ncbi:hypothetical protein Saa2_01140 [Streptomyces acidiscabies]|nr:hypothetical protein Saa2_01140 [Streptomyces acidiscabies]
MTVIAILPMIALGVLLVHLLNSQHGDRIAAFHYGRSGMPVAGPASRDRRKARGRAAASGTGARRDHRDGGRGRLRTRKGVG